MKDIPGYEGRYAITENGKVWSYPKQRFNENTGKWQNTAHSGKWLKPITNKDGCLYVVLTNDEKVKRASTISRWLSLTYISQDITDLNAFHKNGKVTDNDLKNLELRTSDNLGNAGVNALHAFNLKNRKLNINQVRQLRIDRQSGITFKEIIKKYGIGCQACHDIVYFKSYKEIK